MRLFVEAVLDESAIGAAWSAGRALARQQSFPDRRVRWVGRGALHLTLRFLGEVDTADGARVSAIGEALGRLERSGGFELRLDRIGAFGGRRPRVIWVGFAADQGLDRLRRQRAALDAALAVIGIEAEPAAFRPHLTIGRVRRQASPDDLMRIDQAVQRAAPLRVITTVNRVALVHSTLTPAGPRYRRLAFADL